MYAYSTSWPDATPLPGKPHSVRPVDRSSMRPEELSYRACGAHGRVRSVDGDPLTHLQLDAPFHRAGTWNQQVTERHFRNVTSDLPPVKSFAPHQLATLNKRASPRGSRTRYLPRVSRRRHRPKIHWTRPSSASRAASPTSCLKITSPLAVITKPSGDGGALHSDTA